jgi:hypothetical protein
VKNERIVSTDSECTRSAELSLPMRFLIQRFNERHVHMNFHFFGRSIYVCTIILFRRCCKVSHQGPTLLYHVVF